MTFAGLAWVGAVLEMAAVTAGWRRNHSISCWRPEALTSSCNRRGRLFIVAVAVLSAF
jgi:hypothetical protein